MLPAAFAPTRRPPAYRWFMLPVRRRVACCSVVVLLAALGGCAIVSSSIDTTRALQSDGFGNVRVVPSAINGGTTVVVTGQAPPGADNPERLAAQDVWTHFAFRFVALDVRLSGHPAVSYSHDQLAATLGPRPPGFDRNTIGGSVGRIAAVVVGVGSVVLLLIVGLVTFFFVRHRRRHPRPPATGWPGYGPNYGPPPPGYGPPPPGSGPAPGPRYGPPPPGYGPPPGPGYGPPPPGHAPPPPPGYGPPPPGYGPPPAPDYRPPAGPDSSPGDPGAPTDPGTYGYRGGPPAPHS